MSVDGDFWRFSGGELVEVDEQISTSLSVADSWLVQDGQARSLDAHFQRFAGWVSDVGIVATELNEFFEAVLELIPSSGNWFPRLEARFEQPEGDRLFFRLRPAPELTETVTLWTFPEVDPRSNPLVKGPDLSLCQQIRRAANLHGAEEGVLLDASGYIADGALSSIVWWRAGRLYGPDESTHWLPSITRNEVFELALQAGYSVGVERAKPKDLEGCEVWSLSSLQGIRPAVAWDDLKLGRVRLAPAFRKRLGLLSTSIANARQSLA
jgi:branched-subunit amino acid aminotransferase/4-amino-4-deoxychorismate lyase